MEKTETIVIICRKCGREVTATRRFLLLSTMLNTDDIEETVLDDIPRYACKCGYNQ